jgi:hypothetical protein
MGINSRFMKPNSAGKIYYRDFEIISAQYGEESLHLNSNFSTNCHSVENLM